MPINMMKESYNTRGETIIGTIRRDQFTQLSLVPLQKKRLLKHKRLDESKLDTPALID